MFLKKENGKEKIPRNISFSCWGCITLECIKEEILKSVETVLCSNLQTLGISEG